MAVSFGAYSSTVRTVTFLLFGHSAVSYTRSVKVYWGTTSSCTETPFWGASIPAYDTSDYFITLGNSNPLEEGTRYYCRIELYNASAGNLVYSSPVDYYSTQNFDAPIFSPTQSSIGTKSIYIQITNAASNCSYDAYFRVKGTSTWYYKNNPSTNTTPSFPINQNYNTFPVNSFDTYEIKIIGRNPTWDEYSDWSSIEECLVEDKISLNQATLQIDTGNITSNLIPFSILNQDSRATYFLVAIYIGTNRITEMEIAYPANGTFAFQNLTPNTTYYLYITAKDETNTYNDGTNPTAYSATTLVAQLLPLADPIVEVDWLSDNTGITTSSISFSATPGDVYTEYFQYSIYRAVPSGTDVLIAGPTTTGGGGSFSGGQLPSYPNSHHYVIIQSKTSNPLYGVGETQIHFINSNPWVWSNPSEIVSGQPFKIYATDWKSLCTRINLIRTSTIYELSSASFTLSNTAATGVNFSRYMYNEVIDSFTYLKSEPGSQITQTLNALPDQANNPVYASYFTTLALAVNRARAVIR